MVPVFFIPKQCYPSIQNLHEFCWLLWVTVGPFSRLLDASSFLIFYNVQYFLSHLPLSFLVPNTFPLVFRLTIVIPASLSFYSTLSWMIFFFLWLSSFSFFLYVCLVFLGPSIVKSGEISVLHSHVPNTQH